MLAAEVGASPLLFYADDLDRQGDYSEDRPVEETTFSDLTSASSSSSTGDRKAYHHLPELSAIFPLASGNITLPVEPDRNPDSPAVGSQVWRPVSNPKSEDVSLEWDDSGNLRHTKSDYLDRHFSGTVSPTYQLPSSSVDKDRHDDDEWVASKPSASHLYTAVIDPVLAGADNSIIEIAVTPSSMSLESTKAPGEALQSVCPTGTTLPTDGDVDQLDAWLDGKMVDQLSCRLHSGSPEAQTHRIRSAHKPEAYTGQQIDTPSTSPSSGLGKSQFDYPHPEELSVESVLNLLDSIRDEANPLVGLLVRLERTESATDEQQSLVPALQDTRSGTLLFGPRQEMEEEEEFGPGPLVTHDRARAQIDIDLSFLEYYEKHLGRWSTTADDLHNWLLMLFQPQHRHSGGVSSSALSAASVGHSAGQSSRMAVAETGLDLTLLVETFLDWLAMLKSRHSAAQWLLVRRALWMDHLTGLAHEADVSLTGAEKRSHMALQQAIDLARSLVNQTVDIPAAILPSPHDDHHQPATPVARSRTILHVLDDLQALNDNVSAIQVRLDSGHMLTDLWHRSVITSNDSLVAHGFQPPDALSYRPAVLGDGAEEALLSSVTGSLSSPLQVLSGRACTLRRQLSTVIRRLETAALSASLSFRGSSDSSRNSSASILDHSTGRDVSDGLLLTEIPVQVTYQSRYGAGQIIRSPAPLWRSVLAPLSNPVCVLIAGLALAVTFCMLDFRSSSYTTAGWLGLCPSRQPAGTVAVELGPSWFLQQLVCLQLPSPSKLAL